jgi:hypothetical protein
MALVGDHIEPVKVTGGRVSGNFFVTLGVQAALGRTLEPNDALPGRDRVLVLGYPVYEQRFRADPRVIGRIVQLDGAPHQVVGVLPPGFEFVEPGTDLWAPLAFDPGAANHRAGFSQVFGRLRANVSAEAASAELVRLVGPMRRDLAKPDDWGRTLRVASLKDTVTGARWACSWPHRWRWP